MGNICPQTDGIHRATIIYKDMDIKIIRIAGLALAVALMAGVGSIATAQTYENTPVSISKEKVRVSGKVCYSHIVLERQTLFSISKAYNVSIEDIYKVNPTLKETGLVKNSIILIPAEDTKPAEPAAAAEEVQPETPAQAEAPVTQTEQEEPKKETPKKIHTVRWYENLNDIASKYGITVEELKAANNLTGKKLKSRMKLVIPEPGEFAVKEENEPQEVADTVVTVIPEEKEEEKPETPWWEGLRRNHASAALLMPMKATGTSSSWSNMDFYSGVLMAVNDLAANGINIDLKVHDVAYGLGESSREDILKSDVVIGPVSVKDLNSVFAVNPSSMVISPLDPKAETLIKERANLIQAPTPHKFQYDDIAAWIKEDTVIGDKVIMITEKGGRQTDAVTGMKSSIDSSGVSYSPFSYSILEGRDILTPLKSLMTAQGTNRVVIASESEAFVNDVVRNLNLMIHQKYNVVLYAASKIRSFETIEVENFHNTNLHVSLSYYIDYDDERVKNFLLRYRALFNTEPSQFAFQGYDIASYFLEMCSKYGNRWPEMLEKEEKNMLQSTFRCEKEGEGGYINYGVRRIVYESGWKVTKIR